MGGYGSGRPTRHMSTSDCIVIPVKEACIYNVALSYTEQGGAVAGRRAWMICPFCSRRVGKLYLSRVNRTRPACRICLQLNYDSQRLLCEEKQRTYEVWLLEQGYLWSFEEWCMMPDRVLLLNEAKYHMRIGECKRAAHFMKLMAETMQLLIKMEIYEKRRESMEKKALLLEKKRKKYLQKKKKGHVINLHSEREISTDMKAAIELMAA